MEFSKSFQISVEQKYAVHYCDCFFLSKLMSFRDSVSLGCFIKLSTIPKELVVVVVVAPGPTVLGCVNDIKIKLVLFYFFIYMFIIFLLNDFLLYICYYCCSL